jgi:lauroyl/myristoyl acyltransferase
MAAYVLWRLANLLVGKLPLSVSYRGAVLLADLVFLCWTRGRLNSISNMRHVLPHSSCREAPRVARDSFRNYARYLVDFIRTFDATPEELESRIEFDQWDEVDEAFRGGRGVIFLLLHFGNWDWGATVFSRRGYPLNVVAETFSNRRLNKMVVSARRASGTRVLPMERGALPLVRALRRNEALAILIDRPGAAHGIPVQFFGATAYLPAGPARLALHTGARVIAVAVGRLRETSDKLYVIIDGDISIERTGDEKEDARRLTEATLRAHERFVRRHPDQWYMFRRMWPGQDSRPVPAAGRPQ